MGRKGTDATSFEVELPYPPSVNHYWRSVMINGSARVLISAEGRAYRYAVHAAVGLGRTPLSGRLAVDVSVWVPDRKRRDLDNVLKALLDACTSAGLWGDDSQIHKLTIVKCGIARPTGRIVLRAEQLEKTLF